VGEYETTGSPGGRGSRTVRLAVVAALAVAAGCAGLLVAGRLGPDLGFSSADCDAACGPGILGVPSFPDGSSTGTPAPAVPGQHPATPPAPVASPPAAPSSAPVSASALVQFKVTSHWDDGYRADVTITDTGAVPLTGWRLTFHVAGARLHQPTDTGETAMAGDVVTVTPAAWRRSLAAGARATFGMGFDGALAAPGGCLLDGAPCELRYVDAVPVPGQ
jgi:hypothetical protein